MNGNRIDVEIGYKITYPDGKTAYFGDSTGEGRCYRDAENYDKGEGIFYIPECALADIEGIPMTKEEVMAKGGYDYAEFKKDVEEYIKDFRNDISGDMEDFIRYVCDNEYIMLDWISPQARLDGVDWEETVNEWNNLQRQ